MTLNVVNQAPVANADFYVVPPPWFVLYDNLTANDSDGDDGPTGFNVSLDSTWQTPPNTNLGRCGERCWSIQRWNGVPYVGLDIGQYRDVDWLGAYSGVVPILIFHPPLDDHEDAGASCPIPSAGGQPSAPSAVGEPINVTNGNMWIEHYDYSLPGIGESIEIKRFYNSIIQRTGLFGLGWSTKYDESLWFYGDKMLRLNMPDGQAVYFGRANTIDPFRHLLSGVEGQVVKNADNTYVLTLKDGRTHKFDQNGKLLWQKDQNENQTTLTYDVNGLLTGVTDASGRTLTLTPNADGTISQISDSSGVIASYEYWSGTTRLKTVTFADASKYKFDYTTISNKAYLTTVKDATDKILETHQYDSQGWAYTSEKEGGAERYTIDYTNARNTSPRTKVTDARGNETTYHFSPGMVKNAVTKVEGACNCGGGSEVTQYFYDRHTNLIRMRWSNLAGHETPGRIRG